MIIKLGGKVIEEPDHAFNVYITDNKLIRNCKLLQSIAAGVPVVSIDWL